MFCPKCGAEAQAHTSFCAKCGVPLDTSAPQAHSAVPKQQPTTSTAVRALKASQIPAGIGAVIGISAAMKASSSSLIGKLILGMLTAAMIGAIFGLVAFVCVFGYLKVRGK